MYLTKVSMPINVGLKKKKILDFVPAYVSHFRLLRRLSGTEPA